jgi:hypothetical protein
VAKKRTEDRRALQTFLEVCGLNSDSTERAVKVRNAELPKAGPGRKPSRPAAKRPPLRKQAKD